MTTRIIYVDNGYSQCLPLVSTTLKSHVVDLTASHTLTQVYNNPSTRDIAEAQYTFPLYESCAVTEFQALVGEKRIKGVVKEKAEARAVYRAAKSAGKVTALFAQDTSEVFTTSIGNIPAGALVVVVIKYVHELKQDIDVDGVRLVIPTVVAPKYGNAPVTTGLVFGDRRRACWGVFSRDIPDVGNVEDAGLAISITTTMSGMIRGITSPSHPISIGLGSHSSADDTDFNPRKAHATLALASSSLTGLDKDFSLLINANNIGDPRAFLAPHPTLKDTSTLMVTMVPKFVLPPQAHEIIFIVDRSGSMYDKITTVQSALQLFLASLPVGSYFNICSFGFSHSFLWPQSQKYSEESLNAAKAHVMGFDSNMGGTEILAPVIATMNQRRPDMRTEILILTDGEVWESERLFGSINEFSKDGNVRFFSLGVGDAVSHSLVEGISRAGRGYSQIVSTTSNLQKKVMRMLKAALTPHVNDWGIDWVGKPEKQRATLITPAPRTVAPISLFDPNCDPDNTLSAPSGSTPTLALPEVVQAPAIIPALFPYSRATVYFLISSADRLEKVFLKGSAHDTSSNTICPLQIEIPVQAITTAGASLGLYQLAGRKVLQDLEEGRLSYLEGIYDKASEPTKHAELIAQEGARVGVEFGLASKWTSFVAVAEDESTREEHANQQVEESTAVPMEGEGQAASFAFSPQGAVAHSGGPLVGGVSTSLGPQMVGFSQTALFGNPRQQQQQAQQAQIQVHRQQVHGGGGGVFTAGAPAEQLCSMRSTPMALIGGGLFGGGARPAPSGQTSTYSGALFGSSPVGAKTRSLFSPIAPEPSDRPSAYSQNLPSSLFGSFPAFSPSSPGYSPSSPPGNPSASSPFDAASMGYKKARSSTTSPSFGAPIPSAPTQQLQACRQLAVPLPDDDEPEFESPAPIPGGNLPSPPPPAQHYQQHGLQSIPKGPQNLASDLAALQQFNGMFKSDWRIFAWLGLRGRGLEGAHADADFVATMAVIVALEKRFPELSEEWELMVSKAREAVGRLYSEGDREAVASAVRAALGV